MGRKPVAPRTSEPKRVDIMRRAIRGVVLACVLAIGGFTGLGTSSAQAQGFGGYPGGGYGGYPGGGAYGQGYNVGGGYSGGGAYSQGFPGGGGYGRGCGGSGGGLSINRGIGGYPAPLVGGYGSGF